MATFQLTMQTPTRQLFSGQVDAVRLKTDLGRMEVLPNHATLVGSLRYSKVYVHHDATEEVYVVRHGTVSVDEEGATSVLVLEGHKEEEMTVETMEAYLTQLKELLESPEEFNDYQKQFLQEQRDALEEGIAEGK